MARALKRRKRGADAEWHRPQETEMNILETAIVIILAHVTLFIWALGFICWMIASVMEFIQTVRGLQVSPVIKKLGRVADSTILVGLIPAAAVMYIIWQHLGK